LKIKTPLIGWPRGAAYKAAITCPTAPTSAVSALMMASTAAAAGCNRVPFALGR